MIDSFGFSDHAARPHGAGARASCPWRRRSTCSREPGPPVRAARTAAAARRCARRRRRPRPRPIGPGPVLPRYDLPARRRRIYGEANGIAHVLVNGAEVVTGTECSTPGPATCSARAVTRLPSTSADRARCSRNTWTVRGCRSRWPPATPTSSPSSKPPRPGLSPRRWRRRPTTSTRSSCGAGCRGTERRCRARPTARLSSPPHSAVERDVRRFRRPAEGTPEARRNELGEGGWRVREHRSRR